MIGPEVIAQGMRVLAKIEELGLCRFEFTEFPWGAQHYLDTGRAAPENIADILRPFDAIYYGAHGIPSKVPDVVAGRQLVSAMRKNLDLYVNYRPIRRFKGVESPLKDAREMDYVIVRENTEGEYSNVGGQLHTSTPQAIATQLIMVTRHGAERVMRFAFETARRRNRKKHVWCVTKSNAVAGAMQLWDDTFAEVAKDYPDITTSKSHVDAMSMYLITRYSEFDVVVTTNLMGDILSEEGATLAGSLGVAASANLRPDRSAPSMFEPSHGSAPDIAGTDTANPLAAIGAGALMLDWLGEGEAAKLVSGAIESVLAEAAVRTRDLGGTATTVQMTDAVIAAIEANA
jgi:tartrate dehydrogenase/decarboxylase/D-malate dehydrogenase